MTYVTPFAETEMIQRLVSKVRVIRLAMLAIIGS